MQFLFKIWKFQLWGIIVWDIDQMYFANLLFCCFIQENLWRLGRPSSIEGLLRWGCCPYASKCCYTVHRGRYKEGYQQRVSSSDATRNWLNKFKLYYQFSSYIVQQIWKSLNSADIQRGTNFLGSTFLKKMFFGDYIRLWSSIFFSKATYDHITDRGALVTERFLKLRSVEKILYLKDRLR